MMLCATVVGIMFLPGAVYTIAAILGGIGEGQPADYVQQTNTTLLLLWPTLSLAACLIVTIFGLATRPWWRAPALGMAPTAALCLLFPPLLMFIAIPAGVMLLGQWLPARIMRGEPLYEPGAR